MAQNHAPKRAQAVQKIKIMRAKNMYKIYKNTETGEEFLTITYKKRPWVATGAYLNWPTALTRLFLHGCAFKIDKRINLDANGLSINGRLPKIIQKLY